MRSLMTDLDMLKLADCLEGRSRWPGEDREHVEALRRKVNGATVVPSADIPADVVTLHSRVRVRGLDDAGDATYTLVAGAPGSTPSAIAVMSPMGVALLAGREGEEVGLSLENGPKRLRIEDVLFQPEAAARLHGRERIREGGR